MSDIRYFEERECPHGDIGTCRVEFALDEPCPGGSRREITVDYAEAWKQLQGRDELRDAGRLPHSPRETELAVRAIVDAALGRGDTREDDR